MNFAARDTEILSRFDRHAEHPKTADLRAAVEKCLAIRQRFADHGDSLGRDVYTREGKRAKLVEALTKQFVREMSTAREPISSAAKGIERLRGQLKSPQLDRTAGAEMKRAEIRTYLRSLPLHEKLAAMSDPGVRDVLDAAHFLSGIAEPDFARAMTERDEQLNGPQLKAIAELQAVVEEADAGATVARNDLASVAELDALSFDRLATPIENLVEPEDRTTRIPIPRPTRTPEEEAQRDRELDAAYQDKYGETWARLEALLK